MNLTKYIEDQNTKTLVDIYNTTSDSPVKKFSDRKAAVTRLTKHMGGNPDYVAFYKANAAKLKAVGIEIPSLEAPAPVTPEQAKAQKVLAKLKKEQAAGKTTNVDAPAASKKQNTPPLLNIRCPHCGFFAKVPAASIGGPRLVCPVAKDHGKLLTAEERGEKRGR